MPACEIDAITCSLFLKSGWPSTTNAASTPIVRRCAKSGIRSARVRSAAMRESSGATQSAWPSCVEGFDPAILASEFEEVLRPL